MRTFWNKICLEIDRYCEFPAVQQLILWLLGGLTFYAFSLKSVWCLLPLLISVAFIIHRRKYSVMIVLGFFMMGFAVQQRDNRVSQELPTESVFGTLRITELSIVPKKYIFGRTKYAAVFTLHDKSYNVLTQFRAVPSHISYGKIYQVSGKFKKMSSSSFSGGFNYARFLAERGIDGVFTVKKSEELLEQEGWGLFSLTENMRAWFLKRTTSGFSRSGVYGRFVVGILLGNKSSVTDSEKEQFVSSGLFHLFAVSGLHVAILSVIFSLLLRGCLVNVRIRCFLMPVLLLFYVIITGAPPSAIRAWAMISTWSVARGLFRAVNLYNTLASAAFILLLYRPLYICDGGFQLSFIIVFFLVRSFGFKKRIYDVLCSKYRLIPPEENRIRKAVTLCWFDSIYLGITVFLAALGLQVFCFGIFQPLSIISAAWSGACAFGVLTGASCKCFLPDFLMNPIIVFFLDPLLLFAEIVHRNHIFIKVSGTAVEGVFFYYFGLILLTLKSSKSIKIGAVLLVVTMALMIFPFKKSGWEIAVISKDNQIQSVVAWNESVGTSVVWLNSQFAQSSVMRLLNSKNIQHITLLGRKKISFNNYNLLDRFRVEEEKIIPENQWVHNRSVLPSFKLEGNCLYIRLLQKDKAIRIDQFDDGINPITLL